MDRTLSAGDTVPDCVLPCEGGALDWVRVVAGLAIGGRIECFLVKPSAGRGRPAIKVEDVYNVATAPSTMYAQAMNARNYCWEAGVPIANVCLLLL